MALTTKKILRLKEPGYYADREGLYLQVKSETNRSWVYRYSLNHKAHWLGLGAEKDVTIFAARAKAAAARQQVRQGIDPIIEKQKAAQSILLAAVRTETFEACAAAYYTARVSGSAEKTRKDWQQAVDTYVLPKIGKLNISAIDAAQVKRCVDPIWHSKNATAKNVRRHIESVWSYAKTLGYCEGENPARWDGHLEHALTVKARQTVHHAALPYTEVGAFMVALRAKEGLAARALEFTALVACRTNEVIGAKWSEFNLEEKVWVIPADRMKAGKEQRVPLCPALITLLQGLPRLNEYVFPIAANAMKRLFKGMGYSDTVHGFRSCFKDWASETTSYQNEVVEMALAHTVGNKVEQAYRRGDLFIKRVRLMQDWSDYCDTVHMPGVVVPMPTRKSA